MNEGTQRSRGAAIQIVHHYRPGDGAEALAALLDGFENWSAHRVTETAYDNHRLHVKSMILQEDPPDAWTSWPGGELRGYVEAGALADTSAVWHETDIESAVLDVAAEASEVDGAYYGVPVGIHRINDLYVNRERATAAGIDPASVGSPRELGEVLATAADVHDGPGLLLPMFDPFTLLQLWEVVLLGQYGHGPFRAITDGAAAGHRDAIEGALEILLEYVEHAPEDAIYRTLPEANRAFVAGEAPLYPQGDWAGGTFVDEPEFEYGADWDRVAFPGTESMYVVVMDTIVPAAGAMSEALEDFLAYVGTREAQEAYNRRKGSLPVRTDVSVADFGDFAREGHAALERSSARPMTITHGISVTPAQLIDLKSVVAEFVDDWDVKRAADGIVEVLDAVPARA